MTLADFAAQLRSGSALPWPGLSLDQAYAVAASNHRLRAAQDAPVGRKIGHTNPAHWAAQGIAAPSWGWLYASSTRPIERAQPLVLGSPLAALGRLMALLAEQGAPPLQAGEIVTTGALAPALPWTGAALRAEIRGLGTVHWKPEPA